MLKKGILIILMNTRMIWIIFIKTMKKTKNKKQNKKRKILIAFDYMIADMLHDKKNSIQQ